MTSSVTFYCVDYGGRLGFEWVGFDSIRHARILAALEKTPCRDAFKQGTFDRTQVEIFVDVARSLKLRLLGSVRASLPDIFHKEEEQFLMDAIAKEHWGSFWGLCARKRI